MIISDNYNLNLIFTLLNEYTSSQIKKNLNNESVYTIKHNNIMLNNIVNNCATFSALLLIKDNIVEFKYDYLCDSKLDIITNIENGISKFDNHIRNIIDQIINNFENDNPKLDSIKYYICYDLYNIKRVSHSDCKYLKTTPRTYLRIHLDAVIYSKLLNHDYNIPLNCLTVSNSMINSNTKINTNYSRLFNLELISDIGISIYFLIEKQNRNLILDMLDQINKIFKNYDINVIYNIILSITFPLTDIEHLKITINECLENYDHNLQFEYIIDNLKLTSKEITKYYEDLTLNTKFNSGDINEILKYYKKFTKSELTELMLKIV